MPNWCQNKVSVSGSKERIAKFKELCIKPNPHDPEGQIFHFMDVAPPDYAAFPLKDGVIGSDKCDAQRAAWGTKWEDLDVGKIYEDSDEYFAFYCDSAWSPPLEFLKTMSEKLGLYAECHYEEPGMQFMGDWNSVSGDNEYDYNEEDSIFLNEDD